MTVGKIVPLRAVRMKAYEATSTSKRLDDWERTGYGPNAVNDDADLARARSQDAVRNNPWIDNALDLIVTNQIGCGIQPRPKIDDAGLRSDLLDLFESWASECDADGALDFFALQALWARARVESGECFVRFRPRSRDSGLTVPLQLQTIEADLLPIHHNSSNGGNSIRQGIERSPYGQRLAYWFYREHPGDRYAGLSVANMARVPAEAVLHHYRPKRPGQIRGEPHTLSALLRARKMDLYESAELTRKQNRAKFNGAIYRETDDENPVTDAAVKVEDDRALVDVEEGYFFKLAQNERVDLYGGDGGNAGVIDFVRTQLRSIAAGMGVPYELMTGDYEGTNDRIMRVILNTFYRRLEMMQDLLAMQVLQPIWAAFLDAVVLSGAINIPGYFDARKRWQRCEWRAHAWSYVNPLQEAQTQKILVDEGFESRSAIVAARGWDVEEVDRQNHEDMLREQAYGLDYGKDPAPASQQDTSQQ